MGTNNAQGQGERWRQPPDVLNDCLTNVPDPLPAAGRTFSESGQPHGIKSAALVTTKATVRPRIHPHPMLNHEPLRPSIPHRCLHCFCPSDRFIGSRSRGPWEPSPSAPLPPSIPTRGRAGDRIYVRSFRDGKNHSQHSRNSQSPLCSNCHLLGPKSNFAVRSKLNLLSPKFGFL